MWEPGSLVARYVLFQVLDCLNTLMSEPSSLVAMCILFQFLDCFNALMREPSSLVAMSHLFHFLKYQVARYPGSQIWFLCDSKSEYFNVGAKYPGSHVCFTSIS